MQSSLSLVRLIRRRKTSADGEFLFSGNKYSRLCTCNLPEGRRENDPKITHPRIRTQDGPELYRRQQFGSSRFISQQLLSVARFPKMPTPRHVPKQSASWTNTSTAMFARENVTNVSHGDDSEGGKCFLFVFRFVLFDRPLCRSLVNVVKTTGEKEKNKTWRTGSLRDTCTVSRRTNTARMRLARVARRLSRSSNMGTNLLFTSRDLAVPFLVTDQSSVTKVRSPSEYHIQLPWRFIFARKKVLRFWRIFLLNKKKQIPGR